MSTAFHAAAVVCAVVSFVSSVITWSNLKRANERTSDGEIW